MQLPVFEILIQPKQVRLHIERLHVPEIHAHLPDRLLLRRDAYTFALDEVAAAAGLTAVGVYLVISGAPPPAE